MRIAMISTPFLAVPPRDYGGTELVVYELVEGLIDQGHEVTLFATGDSCTRARLSCLFLERQWPPNPLSEANHLSWAFSRISPDGFDLIHAHSALALALSRLTADHPMVYTLHHHQVDEFSDFYRHFSEPWYVAISQNQKRLETPLPNCEVIHHGLDPARFEWSETPGDYVCFVGRFSEVKGPHVAIDVAAQAGLPIHIAGEVHPQDQEFATRELADRLTLPHVQFLGCVDVTRKVPLLRDARALLAPLNWEEPFGLILIEAMLSGCPVVAFPRGSAPELIEEGVTGFLVKSPEEMAEVIRAGGILDSFDRYACRRRAVECFSRERLVADHVRLYHRAIVDFWRKKTGPCGGTDFHFARIEPESKSGA
jgi:glycosyltransferase involved in cell wall biosynthesis